MFEDKNMGIPCLGRCLRRVSGSRRVSGCLGMVSRGEKKTLPSDTQKNELALREQ